MNKIRTTIIFYSILTFALSGTLFLSCSQKSMQRMIIITRATGKAQNINYITGDSWRYIPKAQIVLLNPDKPGEALTVLTGDFYSARSPKISYDGKSMLFTAQHSQNDPWQIWEMKLSQLKARRVTSCNENCTDPAYLPDGRLLFSKSENNDPLKAGHSLYTCKLDGSDIKRITFSPHAYFASNVLYDGRILTISRQLYPVTGSQMFMVLRPDGTKCELFYKGVDGSSLTSCGMETIKGNILFIESIKDNPEGRLISISYNRPLHSRVNLTSELKGDFQAVFPEDSIKLLVSYRKNDTERYALYEFDPANRILGKPIYSSTEYDVLEAVVAGKHDRPKKLPSEVDMGVKTGLLLCQDINVSDIQYTANSSRLKSAGIEVMGLDSTLGVVQVQEDGSFYLKVMADKPFQIKTIDESGTVLNNPCGWIWLRPNERRGCVGCHEDPEMVPENRVPLAVKQPPFIIPNHINKIVEKKVSLE